MMVSKVAVIALVAIIAVPIMLGYAMNLEQVTETDYKTNGDTVNVTPLLQNSSIYTDVNANTYQINSNFELRSNNNSYAKILPQYELFTNVKTSFPMTNTIYNGSHPAWGGSSGAALSLWEYLYFQSNTTPGYQVDGNYCSPDGTLITQIQRLHSVYYDPISSTLSYTYYVTNANTSLAYGSINVPDNTYRFGLTDPGSYSGNSFANYIITNGDPNTYTDISAGYYFDGAGVGGNAQPTIKLPDNTKSFVMTINLDSITTSNYTQLIEIYPDKGAYVARLQFTKTTTGSDVSWQVATGFSLSTITDLYYDPSRNDNTYQLYVEMSDKIKTSSTNEKVRTDYTLKYVGGWPPTIGAANPYVNYSFFTEASGPIANNQYNGLAKITFTQSVNERTPTIRMDGAIIKGYEVPVISDQVYDPKSFKENPSTTIQNVTRYGPSFSFGGNTYTVTKGNITLGTHEIPVNGLVLSSTPISGGYENKIGNTVVSTTAQPSTITFNGQWSASISTTAQEEYEYTKTEWTAGSFAWDGVDHNFLMVGLITCLGVFIALGIYARRSGARVLPLMIVCGGAALLFFVML